jgi:multisubunit Na+/H+ antiporter MnhB subunit
MSISSVIKAPLGVQLNRIAFALYAALFLWPLWQDHHTISPVGLMSFVSLLFVSLLGLFFSCVRAPHSRWILALLGILIPAIVFIAMCLTVWSRPQAWWDWLLSMLTALAWFAIPIALAVSLFKDAKTHEYFRLRMLAA